MTIKRRHIQIKAREHLLGVVIISLALSGCVDEYWPKLDSSYEKVLVVDGMITDQPGPYFITLSYSASLDNAEFFPLTGFQVSILDDAGNQEELIDLEDGRYQTHQNGIQGVPGRSYRLSMISPEGKVYESTFEKMQQPIAIDTVWAEYETQENLAYDHLLEGYRFYISTTEAIQDTNFFLWKLTGTYEYTANHFIKYIYDGDFEPFAHYDSLHRCWVSYKVPEIHTQSTTHVSPAQLIGFPLHFVNTEDKKISIRYSLFAVQLVISENAFTYWSNIKRLLTDQGSLYSTQPFQVRGNVENISNPDELVLGYFVTGSVSEYRIFVDRPTEASFYYLEECFLITEDLGVMLWLKRYQWPLYLTAVYGEYGQSPALPVKQECVNCEESGGSIVKPDFWIDKYE